MNIVDVETHLVSLPVRRRHTWAGNYSPVGQRYVLVKLILEDGTYGFCEETGDPIGVARLDARPIATLSLEAQEMHERREKVYRDE